MKKYLSHLGKLFFSSSLLLTAVTFSSSVHKEAIKTEAATTVSVTFADKGYSNEQEITSVVVDSNVTVTFDKGTNTSGVAPKYFASGTSIRCYGGNYFTVALSDASLKLMSISLGFDTGESTNEISTDSGTFNSPTWSGSAQSVKFSIASGSGHRRIASITANYGGTDEHVVSISGSSTVEVGKSAQLSATCSKNDAVSWFISPEGYATIDTSTGLVTGVSVGTATVIATCASGGSDTHTINVIAASPDVIKGKTITEVTALSADNTKLYEITGYVSMWNGSNTDGTIYGSFYLKDGSVSSGDGLYIYGATANEKSLSWNGSKFSFSNPRDFLNHEMTKNVTLGSKITMYGFRLDYKETKEFNGVITSVASPIEQALEYARYFLNETNTICADTTRNNKTELEAIWLTLETQFNALSPEAREIVKTYDVATGGEADATAACSRYDHIITRYQLTDFIGRNPSSSARSPILLFSENNNYMIAVVSVVLFISVTLIGAYLINKKRRYN